MKFYKIKATEQNSSGVFTLHFNFPMRSSITYNGVHADIHDLHLVVNHTKSAEAYKLDVLLHKDGINDWLEEIEAYRLEGKNISSVGQGYLFQIPFAEFYGILVLLYKRGYDFTLDTYKGGTLKGISAIKYLNLRKSQLGLGV